MSDLSNATAKYVISIQTEGSAAPAAADIKKVGEEVTKTTAVIKQAEQAMQGHTAALGGNRMAYMELGHVVRSSADALAIGINPVRVLAMETPRVVQAMSMLGVSMSNLLLPLALIGGAVAVWKIFGTDVEDSTAKTKELMDSLDKIPSLLRKIQEVSKAGRLSEAAASQYGDYLNGKKKLYIAGDGTITTQATSQFEAMDSTYGMSPGISRMRTVTRQNAEASAAQAQQYVNEQLAGRGGLNDAQTAAIAKLKDLEQQASDAALEGINKQIAAVHEQYQKKRDEITATMKVAGVELTSKESAAGKAAIGNLNTGESNSIKSLVNKQAAEVEHLWDEAFKAFDDFAVKYDSVSQKMFDADARRVKEKESALKAAATVQKQLGDLENRVELENLTGEARKVRAIDQTTAALIKQYRELATQLGLSQAAVDNFNAKARAGAELQKKAVDDSALHIKQWQQMADSAAQSFASGMANALVSFADGTKSAEEAFGQFAASFLTQIAEMIIQQEILNAIKSASSYFGSGGTATANATGGVHYAANGIQSVSSATYFPKFNVVAGEAGMEMLTVLAKPQFRSIGGMDAVVGNAGNRRLAITNASDLENSGGRGAGGVIHIRIEHTPETQANIVSNSIKGAVTEVTRQMKRNSAISSAVKGLTA